MFVSNSIDLLVSLTKLTSNEILIYRREKDCKTISTYFDAHIQWGLNPLKTLRKLSGFEFWCSQQFYCIQDMF